MTIWTLMDLMVHKDYLESNLSLMWNGEGLPSNCFEPEMTYSETTTIKQLYRGF